MYNGFFKQFEEPEVMTVDNLVDEFNFQLFKNRKDLCNYTQGEIANEAFLIGMMYGIGMIQKQVEPEDNIKGVDLINNCQDYIDYINSKYLNMY